MRLRVNTAEMRRIAGTEKHLTGDVEAVDVGIEDDRLVPDAPIHVDVHLESVNDGVLVTGTVAATWHGECRRCLEAAGATAVAEIEERYQYEVTDPDASPIENEQLDLVPLVRETVLLELPDAPLCRPECAGLCPACGINLNTGTCDCTAPPGDARWSALDDLKRSLE
jgi:DUF177 domain-containing protein